MLNRDLSFYGYVCFTSIHIASVIIKSLVKINIINLMERWFLDIVHWSKTGYYIASVSIYSFHEVVPVMVSLRFLNGAITCSPVNITQFRRRWCMILTQADHSHCAHHSYCSSRSTTVDYFMSYKIGRAHV
jgi:hypothetical protein